MPSPTADHSFPFRLEFPPELPISARAEEITAAIQNHQVVVLAGETGSGKTTQIPKMCLAAGRGTQGRIACTQPRRVAALSISRRVAEELGVNWGREVGCKIRFNDQTTPRTVIKFLTDGMLLAEVQGDPMLREYDTIIIDEAHERSLNIDFLLGHLRTLRFKRPELKIIITSATIDTGAFSQAFDGAPVVLVEGRTFPVEVIYAPLDELGRDYAENDENEEKEDLSAVRSARAEALHYIDGAVEAVERIVRESTSGDILVFLPSERDIRELLDLLEGRLRSASRNSQSAIELIPLFGRLSNAEQQRVFAPTRRRKIVLATNIAETSLTIPGIRFVVDTGLARLSRYSPQARTRRLPIEPVAQSSAEQRKGRSGRVAEGVCIRLYSEKDFLERPRFTQPEIQRANLADVILRMKAFGLGDIERFPFINMPATKAIRAGYALLEELGALVPSGSREEGARSRRQEAGMRKPESGGQETGDRRHETGDRAQETGMESGNRSPETGGQGAESAESRRFVPAPSSLLPAPASVELTPLGRELARLPVDPTVGRMILQARTEKALREVVVIAAGLSIQDPRERPMDKQQQADAAHRRFVHPDSDFLTLLNIWDAYHDEFESMSQAKLRRFCREHFLSYTRMREWRDIHAQLLDTLRDREDFRMTSVTDGLVAAVEPRGEEAGQRHKPGSAPVDPLAFGTPAYRAIHHSILSGLLGNVAHLDEESGGYKATHDRRVMLFPGSVLFRRDDAKRRLASVKGGAASGKSTPRWIMASEMMETTRLYARTAARIDPQWAIELGAHLLRVSHSEPFWNEQNGRVMVKQRTRLHRLELESRAVSYGRIDPVHATEIFIREGLVNDTVTFPLDFIAHNRAVREKLEDLLTRTRDSGYLNLDEAVYRFYAARLLPSETSPAAAQTRTRPASGNFQPVSSVGELVDLVRERRTAEPRFLMMEPEDLRDPATMAHDANAFPEALPLENRALPLNYAYKPGQAEDGVTLDVTLREAGSLTPAALDWAVPGHLEAKVEHYLRALPKELRRGFVPLAETARSLAAQLESRDRLRGRRESLTEALSARIAERFRVVIDPSVWAGKPPPDHLRVRVRVLDASGRELIASRELDEIHAALLEQSREASVAVAREDPVAWRAARARWETPEQSTWSFDETPERVLVTEQAGAPVYAFPGFEAGREGVARRLFKRPEEAEAATRRGLTALLERQLGPDLMWTQRDLRAMRELGPLTTTLAPIEELQEQAFVSIRRWVTDPERIGTAPAQRTPGAGLVARASRRNVSAAIERGKSDLRGLVPRFIDRLREILTLRQELLVLPDPPPGLAHDLARLIPADFLRVTPFAQLAEFPRYLKAMTLRAERARKNPAKDAERRSQLAPYAAAVDKLRHREGGEAFRWLVEEFRVSLFAQELGTAEPVSAVKLDRLLAALQSGQPRQGESPANAAPLSTAKPIVAAPVTERKPERIKNLNALDKLFGR